MANLLGWAFAAAIAVALVFGNVLGGWSRAASTPAVFRLCQRVVGGISPHLTMRGVHRFILPDMNLGIDDQHVILLPKTAVFRLC